MQNKKVDRSLDIMLNCKNDFCSDFLLLKNFSFDPSEDEAIEKASDNRTATHQDSDSKPAVTKKRKQPTECFLSQPEEKQESTVKAKRRKKKKISDILEKTAPKPGVPADLQNLLSQHFGENRSVIEIEELKLSDSCFLPANDLTHSFSSYLKEICPKWAKLRKNHKEKKSVVMLVICSSALRSLELIKSMTAFKGDCRVLKLFAKHIKIKEQMNMLEKGVFHIGVGTPGRVKALVEQDGLCLNSTKYMILDWNWRDQKLRRMMDIPEVSQTQTALWLLQCSTALGLLDNPLILWKVLQGFCSPGWISCCSMLYQLCIDDNLALALLDGIAQAVVVL
ncbi:protein CMSS1 isoform 6-T6 [Ciconia maguari]